LATGNCILSAFPARRASRPEARQMSCHSEPRFLASPVEYGPSLGPQPSATLLHRAR
jgi:hypothetical protein